MKLGERLKRGLWRYLAAAGTVVVATMLRLILSKSTGNQAPYILFYLAVFMTAFYLGLGPGLFALVLSIFASFWVYGQINHHFQLDDIHQLPLLLIFALSCLLFLALTEQLRREIDRRKALERTLRHSEETFRSIFENAVEDAMILTDQDRKIIAWNTGAENITGWGAAEVVGKTADLIFTEEDQKAELPQAESELAIQHGRSQDNRWHRRKDGTRFWASGTMNVLRHTSGSPRGFLKIFRDETERKRLQELLEKSNEELETRVAERTSQLEKAVEELEGFTYSISHDMRAPLRSMVANSHMLLEDYGSELPEEGRQHLDRVSKSALRMAQLVEDLLIFARLGQASVQLEDCDLGDIARDVALGLDPDCRVEIEEGPDMSAKCDAALIRMVLQNLMENACKYRQRGEEGRIRFGREAEAFFVRDEGIGFDMAYVDKIFQPFERLHRDAEYPGTGIGLANVKRVLDLHEGEVWAESEPGKGSTFYFTLGNRSKGAKP
ncbi:MAG TPA: PAS domain S-box protein [Fimbriimonas sp.]